MRLFRTWGGAEGVNVASPGSDSPEPLHESRSCQIKQCSRSEHERNLPIDDKADALVLFTDSAGPVRVTPEVTK